LQPEDFDSVLFKFKECAIVRLKAEREEKYSGASLVAVTLKGAPKQVQQRALMVKDLLSRVKGWAEA
jgi:hypothetical protein